MPRSFLAGLVDIELKTSSRVPLYQQLFAQLRAMILSGDLKPGSRLPATRQLVQWLDCSRSTVLLVFEMLAAEGYIETRRGSGTYVASTLPDEVIACPKSGAAIRLEPATPRLSSAVTRLIDAPIPESLLPHSRVIYPDVREFPHDLWTRLYRSIWREPGAELAGRSDPLGDMPLRKAIAGYLRDLRGVVCEPEQIAITSGASHAVSLLFQFLLDEGDSIWIEDPSPPWVKAKAGLCNAKAVFVPVDNEGLDVANGVQAAPAARLALVTPSHQAPLGAVLSPRRRAALLEWADRSDAWIVEDDYDSEFRYAGRPLPTLYSLDERSRVFYMATFSKVLLPGLRLGYIVLPPRFVEQFGRMRALLDRYTSMALQPVLASFIDEGHFASHIRRVRLVYEGRQDVLLTLAEKELEDLIHFRPSEAGLHSIGYLAPELRKSLDPAAVAGIARDAGIEMAAFSTYTHERVAPDAIIFGYAQYTEGELRYGLKRFADRLRSAIAASTKAAMVA